MAEEVGCPWCGKPATAEHVEVEGQSVRTEPWTCEGCHAYKTPEVGWVRIHDPRPSMLPKESGR